MVERQSGHNIKTLMTYGRVEYVSSDCGKYYNQKGVVHEVVSTYTPQKKWN